MAAVRAASRSTSAAPRWPGSRSPAGLRAAAGAGREGPARGELWLLPAAPAPALGRVLQRPPVTVFKIVPLNEVMGEKEPCQKKLLLRRGFL